MADTSLASLRRPLGILMFSIHPLKPKGMKTLKRVLKIAGLGLGALLLLLVIGGLYIHFSQETFPLEVKPLQVELSPARVEHGSIIVGGLCAQCHGGEDGKLSGSVMEEAGDFGRIVAPNLTQHPEAAMAAYTDGELYHLLRTGIKRDGTHAMPAMYRSRLMSDEDIYAVIAYLRSEAAEVQPVAQALPPSQPSFLAKALMRFVIRPLPLPDGPVPTPPLRDSLAYGQYLVTARFECYSCHSASFASNNVADPLLSAGYLQGGNVFETPEGPLPSPNITGDPVVGIGDWTVEDFIGAVKWGQHPEGRAMRAPMMPYTRLDTAELRALFAYLQSVR